MESVSSPLMVWQAKLTDGLGSLVDTLPSVVGAIVIVIAGWLLARLARNVAHRLTDGTHRLLDRLLRHGSVPSTRLSRPLITVAGEIAFWTVMLFTFIFAATVAGLQSVSAWLNELIVHLPSFIAGVAIIVAGYLISVYLRELTGATAKRNGIEPSEAIARYVQGAVFMVMLIVGLDQIGIDVVILIVAFAVIGGGLLAGLMVTFALGARTHVSNLIGASHAKVALQPGMRVRIGDVEGDIIEVSSTHINIDAAEGHVLVPARLVDTQNILIMAVHAANGNGNGET